MLALTSLLFPALLIAAALHDVRSFKIPNRLVAVVAMTWPLAAVHVGLPWNVALFSVAAAFIVLCLGFGLFAIGKLGGGDVKLLAASTLWIGPELLPLFFLSMAVAGGLFALFLVRLRKMPLPSIAVGQDWLLQLHGKQKAMPYGVAIAIGGIFTWQKTPFFLF